MPRLVVLVSGKANVDFPPILEAARVLPTARRLGCDHIRIETGGGARVAEFPLATVTHFVRTHGLVLQPDRRAVRGRDFESLRPVWALSAGARTKETG